MTCPYCTATNPDNATQCHTCGAALHGASYSPYLQVGTLLQNGRYAIGKPLGQGGFGITYRGEDTALHRTVAIKELFPVHSGRNGNAVVPHGVSRDDYVAARDNFMTESRILASFNHPSIVDAMDVFEENNTSYLVMEFLEGETLEEKLTRERTMPHEDVLDLAYKLGDALTEVHNANLLHRDIKPANILLENDGRAVLIDFGSARTFSANRTMHHTRVLTPDYAAPEQFQTKGRFGPYTDLFSLAAVLYHALSGTTPPSAMDRFGGMDLSELSDTVPKSLAYTITEALSLRIDERWPDVKTFVDNLEKAAPSAPKPQPSRSRRSDQPVHVKDVEDFAEAVQQGGVVYLAPDVFTLSEPVIVTKDVTIIGRIVSGDLRTVLTCDQDKKTVLDIRGSSRVILKNIALVGNVKIHDASFSIENCRFGDVRNPSSASSLYFSGGARGRIKDSQWLNADLNVSGYAQITVEDSQVSITDPSASRSSGTAMWFQNSSTSILKNIHMIYQRGLRASEAVRVSDTASVNIYDSEVEEFTRGIVFTDASTGIVSESKFRRNKFGLVIENRASPIVTKNVFEDSRSKHLSAPRAKRGNIFENKPGSLATFMENLTPFLNPQGIILMIVFVLLSIPLFRILYLILEVWWLNLNLP